MRVGFGQGGCQGREAQTLTTSCSLKDTTLPSVKIRTRLIVLALNPRGKIQNEIGQVGVIRAVSKIQTS